MRTGNTNERETMKVLNQIRLLSDEHPMIAGFGLFAIFLLLLFFYHDSPVFWGLFVCFSAVVGLGKSRHQ